jgi:hypothetical protein
MKHVAPTSGELLCAGAQMKVSGHGLPLLTQHPMMSAIDGKPKTLIPAAQCLLQGCACARASKTKFD